MSMLKYIMETYSYELRIYILPWNFLALFFDEGDRITKNLLKSSCVVILVMRFLNA